MKQLYLKKISSQMGDGEYDMYQEMPSEFEGEFKNFIGISKDEFHSKLASLSAVDYAPNSSNDFVLYDDDEPVGAIEIRNDQSHYWREEKGDITYWVRPEMRSRGYATEMLKLAFEEARNLGMHEILMRCSYDNTASIRVIEKSGGEFDKQIGNSVYYKIKLA